jgi:hypothetical protein
MAIRHNTYTIPSTLFTHSDFLYSITTSIMSQYRPAREDWIMLQPMGSRNPFADRRSYESLSSTASTLIGPPNRPPASRLPSARSPTTPNPTPVSNTPTPISATGVPVSSTRTPASSTRPQASAVEIPVNQRKDLDPFGGAKLFFVTLGLSLPFLWGALLSWWPIVIVYQENIADAVAPEM